MLRTQKIRSNVIKSHWQSMFNLVIIIERKKETNNKNEILPKNEIAGTLNCYRGDGSKPAAAMAKFT